MQLPKKVGPDILETSPEDVKRFWGRAIIRRDFEMPNGKVFDFYGFGGGDADGSFRPPVIIFALTGKKEVIAVRQWRPWVGSNGGEIIELPGGNVRAGAIPEAAADGELLQETGYRTTVARRLCDIYFDPASVRMPYTPIICTECRKVQEPKPEVTEKIETLVIPWAAWIKMIDNQSVIDNKSIAMTFMAMRHLKLPLP